MANTRTSASTLAPALHQVLRRRSQLRQGCAALVLGFLALGPARLAVSEWLVPIAVTSNGWHAGLLLPAQGLHQRLPALQQRFAQATTYEIGWGDVGFYRAKHINAALALQAMFASRGAVLHVVAVPDAARLVRHRDGAQLCLTQVQYQHLLDWVAAGFARDALQQPVSAGPGIYGDSEFYHATGRYHLLNTCNRWTASALQAAGVRISPRQSLTASSVLYAARWQGTPCPPQ